MASSASVYTTKYTGASGNSIGLVLHWTAQQSQKDNRSTVTWELLSDGATKAYYWYTGSLSVIINGQLQHTVSEPFALYGGGTHVADGTLTVAHDDYGAAALEITVQAGIYEWGSVNCTGTGHFDLDPIARESTLTAASACIEETAMIAITRKNAAFTHTLAWEFGALSGWIDAEGQSTDAPVQLKATSIGFQLPAAFYTQIPAATEGVCTLRLRTYSGNAPIGAEKKCTFTATAKYERCCPEVTASVTDANAVTLALTGDANALIRYHSVARCQAQARCRSSAKLASLTVNGEAMEKTLEIPAVETGRFSFLATDSRGYEKEAVCTLALIPYIKLTANASAARTDPTGGGAVLRISGNYYNGGFGQAENALQLRFRVSGGDWQSLTAVLEKNTYRAEAALTGLDYQSAHPIEIQVFDALETVERTVTVLPGIPVFDWGRGDFTFHVPVRCDSSIAGLRIRTAPAAGLRLDAGSGSVLLFGAGVLGVADLTGNTPVWQGTQGVTLQTDKDGVRVLFSGNPGTVTLLSPETTGAA